MSWYEAEAFAAWAGKCLSTEREWERAARGTDGREYPWGNGFDPERCNSAESKFGKTTPVTKYLEGRSPEDCFDMAGNVWEWTVDWYDDYKETKIVRGGSWSTDVGYLGSSIRVGRDPSDRFTIIGFRCAKDAPKDNM